MKINKKSTLAILFVFLFFWILILVLDHKIDKSRRAAATGWATEISDADGGVYMAKYAYLDQGWIYLKIIRVSDGAVLADRTYLYMDRIKLAWFKDRLIYDTNENSMIYNGIITLPPSWRDRWFASLS